MVKSFPSAHGLGAGWTGPLFFPVASGGGNKTAAPASAILRCNKISFIFRAARPLPNATGNETLKMSTPSNSRPAATSENDVPRRVMVGGLPTVSVTRSRLARMMVDDCLAARSAADPVCPKLVFSSNGQGVSLASSDAAFRKTMLEAEWIHGDGQSIVLASKMTEVPLPERIATTDFFHDAALAAVRHDLSFFIFGGSERQNATATEAIRRLYPDLRIAGRRNGFFRPEEEEDICREIRESGADVLWVGLGKPLQEYWSVRNRARLAGVGWLKTCGGLYAFLSGEAPRAPQWMQNMGLEWLYRTMRDPRRLAWRYLTTNPHSFYQLMVRTRRRAL